MQTIRVISRRTQRNIAQLNLFVDEDTRSDPFYLSTAIISTRIYIGLLAISVITLILFTSLGTQSEVRTKRNPTKAYYIELINKNMTSLSCSCSHITIPYGNFTLTTVDYHPVCSSVFVSDTWINHFFRSDIGKIYQGDFRVLASSYFQLLATFCSHAKRSIQDTLKDFHSQTLLTPDVFSSDSLDAQIKDKSRFLQSSITNSVHQLLQLIGNTTQSNELQTALSLSTIMMKNIFTFDNSLMRMPISFRYNATSDCLCDVARSCSIPSGFFDIDTEKLLSYFDSSSKILANLSGFVVGCSPVESLLQSTLECLFDLPCLHTIRTFIPSTSSISSVYALNENQTEFDPNMTVQMIINKLFIENWSMNFSFSDYYTYCAPIQCSYTVVQQNNALYVLTKLLSLYGGLTVVLRILVPTMVGWWRRRRRTVLSTGSRPMQDPQTTWRWLRTRVVELNLFKTPTMRTNAFERTAAKISTWVYLVLLCLSMITIILFIWLSVRIESKIDEKPSVATFEQLQKKYSGSLRCPCSQITIPHNSFISIFPQFHPVCTSPLTSDGWITAWSHASFAFPDHLFPTDFISMGRKFILSLKTFCELMRTMVLDSSFIFNQSSLITDQVLSRAELEARANQIFNQFKSNTIAESKRSLALILSQTVTMYTTGENDITWRIGTDSINYQPVPTQIRNCSCALSDECREQVALYNRSGQPNLFESSIVLLDIPNIFTGCFAIQSLLQSSLECFFDQTCVDPLVEQLNFYNPFKWLWINSSILEENSTRFSPKTRVENIINEMMIETWNENFNYNQYYEKCAPKLCTYLITTRNNVLYIIITMIGLIGGLSAAFRIIVPFIVTWILKKNRPRVETDNTTGRYTIRQRLYTLWQWIKTKTLELNLFKTEASWNDHHRRRYEIITTRTYLLILTCTIMILIVYTSFTVQTQSFTEKNPSPTKFEELVANPKYSTTLDCPCENISIEYKSFVSISLQYHQICLSDFVVNISSWINLVHYGSDPDDYPYDDYRRFIVSHFRLLFHLCTLASTTFNDTLSIFYSNTLISKQAQSRQAVERQMKAALHQFNSSIPQMFMRTLDFIRKMAQENGLVSSIGSNWYPTVLLNPNEPFAQMIPRSYENNTCSCATNSTCASPAFIDEWIVPGLFIGCYPLESLLQSTLECLYNITCINKLKNSNQSSSNIIFHPLNSTLSSPHATVQSLMNILMLDRWKLDITYEHYYAICATLSCTYVNTEKSNTIYIITTIIGFYGGLSVALKIIVPVLVKIVSKLIRCRRRRVEPHVSVISNRE